MVNGMDCCIVCLQSNCHPFSRINIHSSAWNKEHIQRVVEKHLWWWYLKPKTEVHQIRWICKHCWQEISSFHSFYLKVEMVHKQYHTLLGNNITETKPKEVIFEDKNEVNFFDKNRTVKANVKSIEQDKPCSSSDLVFNKKMCQKQTIKLKSGDQEKEKHKRTFKACIKNKSINDEYKKIENDLRVFKVKEESQNNYNLNDDDVNNSNSSFEQNYNDNYDTGNSRDRTANVNEDKEFSEGHEPRAIYGKLKKNDIIDFYDEFQFKLECVICNSWETTFANLCSHYKDQHNMRGFAMCCGVKFSRRYLLIDHLCVHKNPSYFKCHKCHRVYSARDNLNFHLRKNKCTPKFECNECGKQFLILKNLMRHKLTHNKPKDGKLNCKKCKRIFDSETLLNRHTQTENCNMVCNYCGEIFFQSSLLESHISKHCPEKKLENSNTINEMESEIILGGNEDIMSRIKIEPVVDQDDGHITSIESNTVNDVGSDLNSMNFEERDKNECNKNSENDDSSNTDGENNTCRVKGFKNMYTPSVSDDFFRKMQYTMECYVCNMILPDFQSLISHYRIAHNKVGYGMCCGKKFYKRGVLADHLKLHKDPDLFKCNLCNRRFNTRRGLEKHIEKHMR